MRNYVVMSDVNTDINPQYAQDNGIEILPQYYHFNDGVIYGDEIRLSMPDFYKRLEKERAYSIGVNPDKARKMMEPVVQRGDDIIVVMASSECSGSYSTVCNEADALMSAYPECRIHVVDSLLESGPAALLVYLAQEMKKKGCGFEETVEAVEKKKYDIDVFFLVDHLDYLVRGGRLSALSGAVGTMLNIKPILHFEDGKIVSYEKCRGRKAAKKKIMEDLKKEKLVPSLFTITHSCCYDEAKEYAFLLEQELGVQVFDIGDLNPTIGSHTGPGALGIAFCRMPKEQEA